MRAAVSTLPMQFACYLKRTKSYRLPYWGERLYFETVAMGCLYLHDMERLIAAKDHDRLESRLGRFYAGVKGEKIEPVHVMDAMRHLEEADAAYIEYLDRKYGVFTTYDGKAES